MRAAEVVLGIIIMVGEGCFRSREVRLDDIGRTAHPVDFPLVGHAEQLIGHEIPDRTGARGAIRTRPILQVDALQVAFRIVDAATAAQHRHQQSRADYSFCNRSHTHIIPHSFKSCTHSAEFFSPTVLLKKGLAILVVLAVLVGLLWLAGVEGFWQAFAVGYGMWLFIDWYDCFFLDWVLFANMKAVRLPGTEHMDKAYHQKRYHFVQSLWGMLIGLIPCHASAGLYAWLF